MTLSRDNGGPFSLEISDRAPGDWGDLISRDPASEFTQSQYWNESLRDHLPGAGSVWLSLRRSGELVGGLNALIRTKTRNALGLSLGFRRLASSFEGSSGGPVIAGDLDQSDQDHVFGLLVDALADQPRGRLGSCAMVLSPAREMRFGPQMLNRSGWVRKDAPTAVVSLAGGIDPVGADRLDRTKRKERNRGLRGGAEIIFTADPELLIEYYDIYDQASRHWGVEPVPLDLMQALLRDPEGRVFFTCVRLNGKVIGGHLNLHHGDKVLAWNGVTDPGFARTHYPSTLCFWGDMDEACRRGAAWLDFGGSGGVASLTGFKKFFGAEFQMRGLYLRDSLVAGLLRRGRETWRSKRESSPPERWHDPQPGAGEGAQS